MSLRPLSCAFVLALTGCGDVAGSTGPTTPTLVAVAPKDFAGQVPCSDTAGAMQSYVATIYDLGTTEEPISPFALPSGVLRGSDNLFRPTPCLQTTAFSFVISGHRYDAEVDAYDRKDLVAVGPGSRHLVDQTTGAYVAPRWTTTCGRKLGSPADGPVTAATYFTRFVRGCAALESDLPPSPTGISVSLDDALGQLVCGDASSEVNHFEVQLAGGPPAPSTAACGDEVLFSEPYIQPAQTYFFDVSAFEKDATVPHWQTSCFRAAIGGTILPAACDPLSEIADTAAE